MMFDNFGCYNAVWGKSLLRNVETKKISEKCVVKKTDLRWWCLHATGMRRCQHNANKHIWRSLKQKLRVCGGGGVPRGLENRAISSN